MLLHQSQIATVTHKQQQPVEADKTKPQKPAERTASVIAEENVVSTVILADAQEKQRTFAVVITQKLQRAAESESKLNAELIVTPLLQSLAAIVTTTLSTCAVMVTMMKLPSAKKEWLELV
jgi:hypothetical protein